MPEVDLTQLAKSLYDRRHAAVDVPFEQVSLPGWQPTSGNCHHNTDHWVLNNPGSKSVRGWIVIDFHESSAELWPFCHFTAHSVVEDSSGHLFDVTPSLASRGYPFLRHEGPDDQFQAIVLAGYAELNLPIP